MSTTEQGLAVKQSRFVMPIADDVRLVTVDTARAVAGVTAEEIKERYEDHLRSDHLPAFDLSLERNLRGEARIWARALRAEFKIENSKLKIETLLADCLLTNVVSLDNPNFNLNSSQLERAWCVSNQTILRLIAAAELKGVRVGRNWKVNRLSAAGFLRRRAL
jgi:hypothetical protein